MTTLTHLTGIAAFDTLAAEWTALLKHAAFDTLFLTPTWQRLTWQEFGQGEAHVLALRDAAGALIGVAPFAVHDSVLGFACYKEISDYLDVIVAAGHEAGAHAAIAGWLLGPDAPAWTALSLTNVREDSALISQLAPLLCAAGCAVETPPEDVCPVIALPETFEAWLESLDGRERRETQRKLRRASEESALVFATDPARLDADVDDFLGLMKASMFTKNDFMTPAMAVFFKKMAHVMAEAGWLQLAFLEVGDEAPRARAAAYLNFVYNDSVLIYNSGLDPARFAHISPGQVLIARLIEDAIAKKYKVFDFLQGNESYKYKLGGKDMRLVTLRAARSL